MYPPTVPSGADGGEGFRDVAARFDVDGDVGGAADETREVVIGAVDHEMYIDGSGGGFGDGIHEGGAERNVVHEMAVHDIEMVPVGSGGFGAADFFVEASEVAGEDGWGDEDGVHGEWRVGGWELRAAFAESG